MNYAVDFRPLASLVLTRVASGRLPLRLLASAGLGKLPRTAPEGLIYSSEAMSIDRGCP
jgi:hypothetical protein